MNRQETGKRSRLVPAGIVLFVLAIVASGIGMIPLMRSAFEEPRILGTSTPRVMATEAGERYMLWVRKSHPGAPVCTARDVASGEPLATEPVTRFQNEGRRSIARFEAQSAETELACAGQPQTVYLTAAFDERWMSDHLVPVFVPFIGFGAAGALCLWWGLRRQSARRSRRLEG